MHDEHSPDDDGFEKSGTRYMISDKELNALGDALLAWETREDFARWWEHGSLDSDATHAA